MKDPLSTHWAVFSTPLSRRPNRIATFGRPVRWRVPAIQTENRPPLALGYVSGSRAVRTSCMRRESRTMSAVGERLISETTGCTQVSSGKCPGQGRWPDLWSGWHRGPRARASSPTCRWARSPVRLPAGPIPIRPSAIIRTRGRRDCLKTDGSDDDRSQTHIWRYARR